MFEGLKISKWEKNWVKYPILYVDFVSWGLFHRLITKIKVVLKDFESENGIQFDESYIQDKIDKEIDDSESPY